LPWTKYGIDKIGLVGSLGSEPRLALSHTGVMRRLSGAEGLGLRNVGVFIREKVWLGNGLIQYEGGVTV